MAPSSNGVPAKLGSRPRHPSVRGSLRAAVFEGAFADVFGALTSGAFLIGFGLYLGLSPLWLGVLIALPHLAQPLQLFSAHLTSALRRRKSIALVGTVAGRLALLPLLPLPFAPWPPEVKRAVFLAASGLSAAFCIVGNNAWLSWMGDLVPSRVRGRYFALRTAWLTFASTTAGIGAGLALDHFHRRGNEELGFAAIYGVALLAAAAAGFFMGRQREVSPGDDDPPAPLKEAMLAPLRHPTARGVLIYLLGWNLAVGVAAPFFTAFMLEHLKMSFTLIACHGAATALVRILTTPLWGQLIDRVGARPVAAGCSVAISFIPLLWLFPRPGFLHPVWADAVVAGTLWSGHNLAAFNLPLSVSPKRGRSFYLAAFAIFTGMGLCVSSVAGGALAERIGPRIVSLGGLDLVSYQVLFLASAGLRLVSSLLILRIKEPVEKGMPAMLQILGDEAAKRLSTGGRWLRLLGRPSAGVPSPSTEADR